jgi:hypothetical protein
MARTIAQIQQSIITAKQTDPVLSGLTSTSNTAVWLLWTYIVAVCQWVVENYYDAHKAEVDQIIATQRAHTLQWYVTRAKQFQYGVALPAESDTYSLPSTDPAVAIISYAAAVEMPGMVRLKVATQSGGALAPLTTTQLTAFIAYIQQIKDAGVRMQITSPAPDVLRLKLKIYYDPLVIDATGARIDGSSAYPVKDAVNAFLKNLPFNGLFVINNLIAALQAIEGVVIGVVDTADATYAALPFSPVTVEYAPDAGYMITDEAYLLSNVIYLSHSPI